MALILLGRTLCPLCKTTIEEGDEIKSFPAFLPYTHKFGKYSDAAFHLYCFELEPDYKQVDDMFTAWWMTMEARPRNVTLEEGEAWLREAFKDWPPKNGVVIFEPLFPEDSEDRGFWMDADSYDEMIKCEEEQEKQQEERRKRRHEEEYRALRYFRDD